MRNVKNNFIFQTSDSERLISSDQFANLSINLLLDSEQRGNTSIPRFTLLMWGLKKKTRKQKPRKSRLLSSTKVEEIRIEL